VSDLATLDETLLNSILESSGSGYLITDSEGYILYINRRVTDKTGYELSELSGKSPSIIGSGGGSSDSHAELWKCLQGNGTWRSRLVSESNDGQRLVVLHSINPILGADGKTKFLLSFNDSILNHPYDQDGFPGLVKAIAADDVYIVGQPIYDVYTGQVNIVEVLIRWTHDKYGHVSPLSIIELASQNNYLSAVAIHVVEKLISFLVKYHNKYEDVCFAINLNMPQIINSSLIINIIDLLDVAGINRSKIIFESTESDSLPIALSEAARHFLWIRDQGFLIAIDDFGSGYSTLDYINNLSVNIIKIDRSLVNGIEKCSRRLDTLLSLLKLCERQGVLIVVEGIENQLQHNLILAEGIRGILVQGFLYARPAPLSEKMFRRNSMSNDSEVIVPSKISREA